MRSIPPPRYTYLLYLRFQLLRGVFDAANYRRECALLRAELEKLKEPHWREFLERWTDPLAR